MFSFRKKTIEKKETPFYAEALEICFHPVYTQSPMIYLMTKSEETRVQFLAFEFGSMDVYFNRFEDPESIRTRWENVSLFEQYMKDREAVLADPEKTKTLTEHVDALFKKVLEGANDLSLDDKMNMVLYNAKGFLGMEPRARKKGRLEQLKSAWARCEADANEYLADREAFLGRVAREAEENTPKSK